MCYTRQAKVLMKSMDSKSQTAWVPTPALPLMSLCAMFSHLQNKGDNYNTYFMELLGGLNELSHIKQLEWYLTHSKAPYKDLFYYYMV